MAVLRTVCLLSTWSAYMYETQHTRTLPFVPYTGLRNEVLKITVTNRSITSKIFNFRIQFLKTATEILSISRENISEPQVDARML